MPQTDRAFAARKQTLLNTVEALARLAEARSKAQIAQDLRHQADRLKVGELNVVVCGECRRGKSSLINAFLGIQ
ncbi:MAG TPA: hypothetical protein PKY05_19005, partial [Fibrobacteria bacterium]|nr:hypothetical protein [Fibrobacteria bacterium]